MEGPCGCVCSRVELGCTSEEGSDLLCDSGEPPVLSLHGLVTAQSKAKITKCIQTAMKIMGDHPKSSLFFNKPLSDGPKKHVRPNLCSHHGNLFCTANFFQAMLTWEDQIKTFQQPSLTNQLTRKQTSFLQDPDRDKHRSVELFCSSRLSMCHSGFQAEGLSKREWVYHAEYRMMIIIAF